MTSHEGFRHGFYTNTATSLNRGQLHFILERENHEFIYISDNDDVEDDGDDYGNMTTTTTLMIIITTTMMMMTTTTMAVMMTVLRTRAMRMNVDDGKINVINII